jgi:hypothetical protein
LVGNASSQSQTEPDPEPPRSGGGGSSSGGSSPYWGAIGFTADGSYASIWKQPSKPEAEANVAKRCAAFGRGACEVVSFPGELCVGLASFQGRYRRRRWSLAFTGGARTYPEAQQAALARCNNDERTRNRCQIRTVVCGDGR